MDVPEEVIQAAAIATDVSVDDSLGIPGMTAGVAANFRDKARMKAVFESAGIPCARSRRVESSEQAGAFATDVGVDDIRAILIEGYRKSYGAGEYLFHESMPRRWVGIIEEGEVELLRGLHGSATDIAVLGKGALIGEGALLTELPHTASAVTRGGVTVWQVSRETSERVREQQPEIFYRVVARASQRVNERLRAASAHLERSAGGAIASITRREHDLLGWRLLRHPDAACIGEFSAFRHPLGAVRAFRQCAGLCEEGGSVGKQRARRS